MYRSLFFLFVGAVLARPPAYPLNNGTTPCSTSGTSYALATGIPKPLRNATSTASVYSGATATAAFGGDYVFPSEKLGPIPTLKPVIPDTVNLRNVNNLTPCKSGAGDSLHYLQKPQAGTPGIYAIATPDWKAPSVVLDHSSLVKQVEFSRGSLIVYFTSAEAFQHAMTQWNLSKGTIFVTFTPGCGKFESNERCYYESTSIAFHRDSYSAVIKGSAKDIQQITNHIELQWGDYSAGYTSGGGFAAGQNGGAASGQNGGATTGHNGGGATNPNGGSISGSNSTNSSGTANLSTPKRFPNCTAPIDRKYGLPTACLGYGFDGDLDENLGLFNLSHFDYADLVSDIALQFVADDLGSDLSKRGIKDTFQRGAQFLEKKGKQLASDVSKGAEKLKTTVHVGVQKAQAKVKDAFEGLQGQLKTTFIQFQGLVKDVQDGAESLAAFLKGQPIDFPLDMEPMDLTLPRPKSECEDSSRRVKRAPAKAKQSPRKTKASKKKKDKKEKKDACEPKTGARAVESPWGDKAVLLKTFGDEPKGRNLRPEFSRRQTTVTKGGFVNIYCVSCGLTGSLSTKGSIIFSTSGITGGKLEGVIPNMAVGVGIGILGQYVHEHSFKSNLYDIPLSPFTIGFATIGPILSVGTHFKYGIKLSGNIHARADVKFENSRFSYDFATKKFGQENFFPKSITPGFSADAGIELTGGFGVPVGLELALTVGPCAMCKGSVGIITQPTLEINATMAAEAQLIDQTGGRKLDVGIKSIDGCKGISIALTARNYLFGSIKSFSIFKDLDHIFHTSPALNLHKSCIPLGAQPPKTSKRTLPAAPYDGASQLEARQLANATTSTNSTSKTYDLTEFVVETDEDLEFVEYFNAEVPYNYEDDEQYWIGNVELFGSNGSVLLASCNDGNVYMQTPETYYDLSYYQSCTSLWAGFEDVVVSSPNGEFLHYYNNTMSKVGVSRLRSAPATEIPETSVYVALAPFAYDTGSTILAAFDTNDNIFFPVVCTYAGTQGARIFLVNEDIEAGIKMLKSSDVVYSVTNGQVKDCQVLFLAISDRPDDSWSAYDPDVSAAYETEPLALSFNSTMLDTSGEVIEDLLLALDDEDLDFTDVWDDEYWLDFIDELFDDDDNSTSVLRR